MLSGFNYLYYQWKRNNWILYARRLFDNYKNVKINRPIFMVGNQGDGLTLVSRMLRRHPNVISITGGAEYWSGADEMQKVMMCRLPRSLRLGGRFVCKDFIHEKLSPPRSWSYGADDLIEYYRKTAEDYDDECSKTLKRIIREALYRFGANNADFRFIDKSQVFSVKMSYVDSLVKDTDPIFLLVTRNPYVTCYRAAIGKAGDMRRYAKYMSLDERFEICIQHWVNTISCVITDMDFVSNFHWVRFEDVLHNPERSLSKLCASLNLSFVDGMIPREEDVIPFGSKYRRRWYPLLPKVNEKYLEKIPKRYIEMMTMRFGSLAERFGYTSPLA